MRGAIIFIICAIVVTLCIAGIIVVFHICDGGGKEFFDFWDEVKKHQNNGKR